MTNIDNELICKVENQVSETKTSIIMRGGGKNKGSMSVCIC